MIVVTADLLFDGVSAEPLRNPAVVVDGARIAAVVEQRELNAASLPAETERIDLPGATLMPGLIDAHIHLIFDGSAEPVPHLLEESDYHALVRMTAHARAMLDAGITTARDLGCRGHLDIEIRRCIEEGLIPGPRLLCVGQPITVTGGHCHFLGGEADGELEVRRAVRRQHKAGADWIKIFATGGHMTPGSNPFAPQYTVAELAAAREEAHRLGHGIAAHCHGVEGVRRAVAAGVDTLEHCSFQVPGGLDLDAELIAEIANQQIAVAPTLSANLIAAGPQGEAMRETAGRRLRAFAAAGVRMIASTDCGIPNTPHTILPRVLPAFAALSGLSAADVLRNATSCPAAALGLGALTGSLVPGLQADLIAVRGNPLDDLTAVQNVALVMKGGRPNPRPLPETGRGDRGEDAQTLHS